MHIREFDYELPPELIAQQPAEKRDESSMLVLDPLRPVPDEFPVLPFHRLPDFLKPGDAVVFNDTRVIPARLFAGKSTGAKIEILLLSQECPGRWKAYVRNMRRLRDGEEMELFAGDSPSGLRIRFEGRTPDGSGIVSFDPDRTGEILTRCGHLPLPPYIRRPDARADAERYQTVYAAVPGAVAAPTAGLHFTPKVLETLKGKGVRQIRLTLHVGAGTFKPVEAERIEDHAMHSERFVFSPEAADELNEIRRKGGRILAVGTTSLRTLESCVDENGIFRPREGDTDIFIYPPYKIRSADMLLTNFHLPKSTLLMLVSAFAGMDPIRAAYRFAIRKKLRFFSYGDCMLIQNRI